MLQPLAQESRVCLLVSWPLSITQSRCLANQFPRYLFSYSPILRWCHPRWPSELSRSPEADKCNIRERTEPSLSPQEAKLVLTPGSLRNSSHLLGSRSVQPDRLRTSAAQGESVAPNHRSNLNEQAVEPGVGRRASVWTEFDV